MKLAIIGDVHQRFGEDDVAYFNASDHDAVLFVGDLYNYVASKGLACARNLAALEKRALLVPGNHDGVTAPQLVAEVAGQPWLCRWLGMDMGARCDALASAIGDVVYGGYSLHGLGEVGAAADIDLLVARPHSMGGPRLAFEGYLRERYGVESMQASAERLRGLVDASKRNRLIVLAHNGPTGLGERKDDIWGCDFRREAGDFGDPDLREALDHARDAGKTVLAVVAGHMHHAVKGGGKRIWHVERDGTHFVNAAHVPRVDARGKTPRRHHVDLVVDGDRVSVTERWVESIDP